MFKNYTQKFTWHEGKKSYCDSIKIHMKLIINIPIKY